MERSTAYLCASQESIQFAEAAIFIIGFENFVIDLLIIVPGSAYRINRQLISIVFFLMIIEYIINQYDRVIQITFGLYLIHQSRIQVPGAIYDILTKFYQFLAWSSFLW